MAFIKYIPFSQASEELKELYRKFGGKSGVPANIIRIAGFNPKAMEFHVQFYRTIMFGPSPLSRHQREMIAIVISAVNGCHY